MTSAQKIIKYIAIAFATFIIVCIVATSLTFVRGIIWLTDRKDSKSIQVQNINLENTEISYLNLELSYTDLIIKTAEELRAETNSNNIICEQENKKITIKEKDHKYFSNGDEQRLILYIPQNVELEKVDIQIGAGKVEIETITAKDIKFELGAGKTEIKNINILDKANIETGAGKLDILSGNINNLKLDIGAGAATVNGRLYGENKLDTGVGTLNLKIDEQKSDYRIKATKGIGTIKINEENVADEAVIGNGNNYLEVNSGVGSVNVNFK